jgi:hypothetical protein
VKEFSIMVLAIAVVVELVWFIGADRYVNLFTASIEATELWHNPRPAPGDQTDVASGRSRMPSNAGVPAADRKTGAAAGGPRTTF